MTLAVNLSVMTAAFYAVLFYMDQTASAMARASWPAPALDPGCSSPSCSSSPS